VGRIPPEIALLSNLQVIHLDHNTLFGPLVLNDTMSEHLVSWNMSHNFLTGQLHPFGPTKHLEIFDFSFNQIESLSSNFLLTNDETMMNLQDVNLAFNRLEGPLSRFVTNLNTTSLTSLQLQQNRLTGSLGTTIGRFTNLRKLSFDSNTVEGKLPTELGLLINLRDLEAFNNNLTGPVISELGHLTNLQTMSLSGNMLQGMLPTELGWLTKLQELWLYDNDLSGTIPTEMEILVGDNVTAAGSGGGGASGTLKALVVYNNQLTGVVPNSLCSLDVGLQFDCDTDTLCGCTCICSDVLLAMANSSSSSSSESDTISG